MIRRILLFWLLTAPILFGDTSYVDLKASGWIASDGQSGPSPSRLGAVDNTWPNDDDFYRSYFWWKASPDGEAIESASIISLGYVEVDYQDEDWFDLRAGQIDSTFADWLDLDAAEKYDLLGIAGDARTCLDLGVNPHAPYSVRNIPIESSSFRNIRDGNFGVGCSFSDTTGSIWDDTTLCHVTADMGPLPHEKAFYIVEDE